MPLHRAQEFREFLDEVEGNVPTDLDIHVVMDNASSHKSLLIRNWFAKCGRADAADMLRRIPRREPHEISASPPIE